MDPSAPPPPYNPNYGGNSPQYQDTQYPPSQMIDPVAQAQVYQAFAPPRYEVTENTLINVVVNNVDVQASRPPVGTESRIRSEVRDVTVNSSNPIGVFAKANFLVSNINQTRRANLNIGPRGHLVWPFGGDGVCSHFFCLMSEFILVYVIGWALLPILFFTNYDHYVHFDDNDFEEYVPKSSQRVGCLVVSVLLVYLYTLMLVIVKMNRQRFVATPWFIATPFGSRALNGYRNAFKNLTVSSLESVDFIMADRRARLAGQFHEVSDVVTCRVMLYSPKYFHLYVNKPRNRISFYWLVQVTMTIVFAVYGLRYGYILDSW